MTATDDQIELSESRLPKHHCAFPKCPMYLKKLSTDKDKALGRRGGLYKHLKYFFTKTPRTYINAFHLIVNSVLKSNPKSKKEEIVKICLGKLKLPPGVTVEFATEEIEFLYESDKNFKY